MKSKHQLKIVEYSLYLFGLTRFTDFCIGVYRTIQNEAHRGDVYFLGRELLLPLMALFAAIYLGRVVRKVRESLKDSAS